MLRQELSSLDPDQNKHSTPTEATQNPAPGVDIQRELNQLEEIILSSPRIPLTRRTFVDEEQLLEQLDLVRLHLPVAFQAAQAIIQQKEEILLQAEQEAEEIIEAAEARVVQILNETDIVRQAEHEADFLRERVQRECEVAQEQTLAEIDKLRRQAQQELEEMRSRAIADCEEIQQGADEYADSVLKNIEQQLGDMLRVIRNGRVQLQSDSPSRNISSSKNL